MIAVDVSCDRVRCPISAQRAREIVRETLRRARVRDAMISVAFVSRRAIARLNRKHLDHPGATDVITFGLGDTGPGRAVVGDVYVCPDVVRENARRFSTAVREELTRTLVHGVLHVLGHDHPEGARRTSSAMWRRQEAIVRDVA